MSLFNFLKKKENDLYTTGETLAKNNIISAPTDDGCNTFGESMEHLDEEGELPFGWILAKNEFTEKVQSEFSFFLNNWLNSRSNVEKEYDALKLLIRYIKDVQKICDSKGECYSKWFSDYVADKKYLEKREGDLKYIEDNIDELLRLEKFNSAFEKNVLPHLRDDLLKIIESNPGILQTDVYKMFEPEAKSYLSSELYFMEKGNLIRRKKQGRSYALFL